MPKVSVIVPVYNAELYIEDCINSILNQSYKELELVLVNDGSTDNSEAICRKFTQRDDVVLVSQPNQGVSIARQNGVNSASGEWVLFVDADDTIPFDAIERMVEISSDVDIVAGATDRDHRHKLLPDYISSEDYIKLLYSEDFGPSPVCKLFKRTLFTNNTIRQFKQFASGEDLLMNLSLAVSNKKNVRICKDSVYCYRMNESSVTHSFRYTYDYCVKYFQTKESLINYVLSHETAEKYGLRQRIRFFYHVIFSSEFHNNNTHPFVKELYGYLTEYQRCNILDKFALMSMNRTLLMILYYLYRLRVRITGRLHF